MGWEVLIVPLLALGVWILGTLFREDEDPRAGQRVRRPGYPGPYPGSRQPVSDLDRFLNEARRRRELAERGLPVPPPPASPPPRQPVPGVRKRPASSRPTAPPPARRHVEEPATMTPQSRPTAAPAARAKPEAEVVAIIPAVEVVSVAPAPLPIAAPRTAGPPPSAALTEVLALLRSPQAARTAFVLREILDSPLCLRRRGAGGPRP